jgi:hypothetical protein
MKKSRQLGAFGYRMRLGAAALLLAAIAPAFAAEPQHDAFYFLSQMNKASAVMVVEQGIVPKPLGAVIAKAVRQVIADQDKPGGARSGDYLKVEQLLIAVGGPDVTRLHSGRSRQDIGSTSRRLFLRDDLIAAFAQLNEARATLIAIAAKNPDAIVPAYTWGVQAQPDLVRSLHSRLCRGAGPRRRALPAGLWAAQHVAARRGGAWHVELPGQSAAARRTAGVRRGG